MSFALIAITGPIIGVIVGGYVFTKIGGYTNPKSLPIAVFSTMFACICGLPQIIVSSFPVMIGLLWAQFFFGGFVLPVMTGILINTMPPSLRTLANSIANLVYNLFGYLPAPFVYGLAYQWSGGEEAESRWGLVSI